jgi:glycosyltransferase involved in cell wall biosynthesis
MGQEQPVFFIVVPTYDRPKQLAACLQALGRLDYARESFEVIVVDDGSKTPGEAVLDEHPRAAIVGPRPGEP